MVNNRLYLYDNLKFLLIVFVVIGHMIDYGGSVYTSSAVCARTMVFIYAFHMPLFIFIAGLFFKAERIAKKVFYYLCVGLVMKAVIFVCQRCLYHTGVFTFSNLNGPDWFMLALAVYAAVTALCRRHRRLVLIIAVLLSLFAGYVDAIGTFLSISRIIVFYPVFLAGTMTDAEALCRRLHKPRLRAAGGAVIVLWAAVAAVFGNRFWFMKLLFTGSTPFSFLPAEWAAYGGLLRALSYLIAGVLCMAFIAVMPQKKLGILSVFGSRTIQVYFWHLPLVFAVHMLDYTLFHSTLAKAPWGYCLGIFVAVGIAMLLSLKPFHFPVSVIEKWLKRQRR